MSKLIKTWKELAKVKPSETHYIKIEDCCGHIYRKDTGEFAHYLSTHTFYGKNYRESTRTLQNCGFDVEIDNWDKK